MRYTKVKIRDSSYKLPTTHDNLVKLIIKNYNLSVLSDFEKFGSRLYHVTEVDHKKIILKNSTNIFYLNLLLNVIRDEKLEEPIDSDLKSIKKQLNNLLNITEELEYNEYKEIVFKAKENKVLEALLKGSGLVPDTAEEELEDSNSKDKNNSKKLEFSINKLREKQKELNERTRR